MYKRLILLVFVFVLCACNSHDQHLLSSKFTPGLFRAEDLSVINSSSQVSLQLGMTKEETDKLLGEPLGINNMMKLNEYEGIEIHFDKDDMLSAFVIFDNTYNNQLYTTARGIKFGDSVSNIIDQYGHPSVDETSHSNTSLTYIIEKSENGFEIRNFLDELSLEQINNNENVFVLSMNVDKVEGLTFLMLADYDYTYNSLGN